MSITQDLRLKRLLLTNNSCYQTGKTIVPKGIMVHSTGVDNPNLCRYVGPDDGLLGKNIYNNHWNQATPDGIQVCVHAFIGKLADGTVAVYQTLPWNYRGWHCGSGSKGSGNDTHISFEICEDNLSNAVYFNSAYQQAVKFCAYLCAMNNLDPVADGVIIGHFEGYKRGIASNHADPGHWFQKHGKNMDAFRNEVKSVLAAKGMPELKTAPGAVSEPEALYRVQAGAFAVKANAEAMLVKLKAAGFTGAFVRTEVKSVSAAKGTPALITAATVATEPITLYCVQVGAFSVRANAEAMLAKTKAAGFTDAFIRTE